jgi:hypothetical protein
MLITLTPLWLISIMTACLVIGVLLGLIAQKKVRRKNG